MKVGIVADTHDNMDVIGAAVDCFEGRAAAVVHCGDIVAPFAATPFDADFQFYAVRGNNDGEPALGNTVREFGAYLGEMGKLSFEGTSFAVYHGTSKPIVDALVDCGNFDYVLHGHTHERAEEEGDGTVRINPGGIPTDVDGGEPPAGVILDTETGETEWHDLR